MFLHRKGDFLGVESFAALFGAIAVFRCVLLLLGLNGNTCFLHFGDSLGFEVFLFEVGLVEITDALVLVDFGFGFELARAEIAAFFGEVGVGLNERFSGFGLAALFDLRLF